ncbi:MAG: AAA-like domain-containing protein [Snowella sp.]|nr:AAA-like domain-containing protein [Snowella sp.]
MGIEDLIDLINSRQNFVLTPLKKHILRGAWRGLTYAQIAQKLHYQEAYIKNMAAELWHDLSELYGEAITKNNFRFIFSKQEPEIFLSNYERFLQYGIHHQRGLFEFPGSPIPADSPFYIERPPLELSAYAEIHKPGSVTCIHSPIKMGKSSLLIRILEKAQQANYFTVVIDLKVVDDIIFHDLDKFLRWFCVNVSRQLEIPHRIDDYWDDLLGSKMNCTEYFQNYLLAAINQPLILAFNEFNRIFNQNAIVHEFSSLLRFWHEQSKQRPIWEKLRLIIVNSIKNFIPLDPHQSPFNVGLPLEIPPLNLAQIQDLANRYELDWMGEKGQKKARVIFDLVGGHPYLIRLLFYYFVSEQLSLVEVEQVSVKVFEIYQDYLQSQLLILQRNKRLLNTFQEFLINPHRLPLDSTEAYQLESLGFIRLAHNKALLSCKLYQIFFENHLL